MLKELINQPCTSVHLLSFLLSARKQPKPLSEQPLRTKRSLYALWRVGQKGLHTQKLLRNN